VALIRSYRVPFSRAVFTKGVINVLWLSPTTFISVIKFFIENELHDYEMRLEKRINLPRWKDWFRPKFMPQRTGRTFSSANTVCGTFASLPVDYFSSLLIRRSHTRPKRCPTNCVARVLSILPADALPRATPETRSTKFIFDGPVAGNELRAILSHHFHPCSTFEFGHSVFNMPVPMERKINWLGHARYLDTVVLPRTTVSGGKYSRSNRGL
jgi:hypothetical protein